MMQSGYRIKVDITSPHVNNFARVLGATSWNVSVKAAAITGSIDTAVGAAPWTMHINAFNADGTPKYGAGNPQNFGDSNGDYPNSQLDIAWTDFNGNNNVNTNEVRQIINGSNVVTATFDFDQYLGQHNQGNHTALYSDVDQYLAGHTVPVPIVGPGSVHPGDQAGGCFVGLGDVLRRQRAGRQLQGPSPASSRANSRRARCRSASARPRTTLRPVAAGSSAPARSTTSSSTRQVGDLSRTRDRGPSAAGGASRLWRRVVVPGVRAGPRASLRPVSARVRGSRAGSAGPDRGPAIETATAASNAA